MLNNTLINHLSDQISQTITSHNPLQGGDINDVYLIKTTEDQFIQIIESENKNPILRNTLYTKFTETKNTLEKRWILTM